MNPRNLFALTENQKQLYPIQPDEFPGYNWHEETEEYELPPYVEKSSLRFWYNTQCADFSTHWHNAQEIIVPLEEGYEVTVRGTSYQLEPGDIFLIPSGELHSLKAPPTGARFIFLFELDLLCRLGDFSHIRSFLTKPVHITADFCPSIYEKAISLIMQSAGYYWGSSTVKQLHIFSCLMEFYACYTDFCTKKDSFTLPSTVVSMQKDTLQRLNAVLKYMEQHYSEKITLEDAAHMVHLSKFYFTRVFKQYTGQTFYDYLNIIRIQAAVQLLKDTDTPMSRISTACGYASVSSFNRSFRKIKSCTPSEFRNFYGHGMGMKCNIIP